MSSYLDPETRRWYHSIRQSDLDSVDMCPERGRRTLDGTIPRTETDSTALGTAAHAGAETALNKLRASEWPSLESSLEVALTDLEELHRAGFEWTGKFKSLEHMETVLERVLDSWFEDHYVDVAKPVEVEWNFHVPLHSDDTRSISLKGTADLVDEGYQLWDWKFPSREYKAWEKNRFATQPTVYAYAARQHFKLEGPLNFRYGITMHNGKTQRIDVVRTEAHDEWLKRKCIALAKQIEAELDQWALNDQGWWCSPTWCPVWSECKGADLGADPWNQLEAA